MTTALHHYPRRFRWVDWPTGATLLINGREIGGVLLRYPSRGWGPTFTGRERPCGV